MKIIVCCLLSLVSSGLVWAGGGLQGTVRDSRGDPIKGAEIRIQGKDGNLARSSKPMPQAIIFPITWLLALTTV